MPTVFRRLFIPGLLLTALVVVLFLRREAPAPPPPPAPVAPVVETDVFGLPRDRFEVRSGEIRRNETFSDLLAPYDVPYPAIVDLAAKTRDVFDVRGLRAGHPYHLYLRRDSTHTPAYLIYEPDAVRYVVYSLADSLGARLGERPVTVTEQTTSGVITGSLYNTLLEQDVDPLLAVALSEVFAWQIDFYRIQKGDAFSVTYETRSVAGTPIGLGRILAARFRHLGRNYYAYRYDDEATGTTGFYDEEGQSLRKAFLMSPVKYARISSRFSGRRFHPVQKRYKAHLGTDYAAPTGTPIRATGDGVVLEARYRKYNGNYVKIRHNGTYTTGYLHMSRIAKGIRPGVTVRQGDVIGYVGSTGLATGPHVCYRFWKNGRQVNHLREEFPSAEPLPATARDAFAAVVAARKPSLTLPDDPGAPGTMATND